MFTRLRILVGKIVKKKKKEFRCYQKIPGLLYTNTDICGFVSGLWDYSPYKSAWAWCSMTEIYTQENCQNGRLDRLY